MTQPFRPAPRKSIRSAHAKLFGTGDLNPTTRCSIIVAHPADEVVGAGCLISRLVDVTILHVTDGVAGFEDVTEYAQARRQECISALAIANVPEDHVVDLAVPDHRASLCLADLTKRITAFLQQSAADIVVTHPYEGGHPDHDATAFATHAAFRLLKRNGFKPPSLFEMALHPGSDGLTRVPEFLPGSNAETTTLLLDERSQDLKLRMFACFETQRDSLKASPIGPERFRQPPGYDFTAPPQAGRLHYENFDWAPARDEWQALACKALADLFPDMTSH